MTAIVETTDSPDAASAAEPLGLGPALQLIDSELGRLLEREIVTANEVSDLLLDLRLLLAAAPQPSVAL